MKQVFPFARENNVKKEQAGIIGFISLRGKSDDFRPVFVYALNMSVYSG